MLYYGLGLEEPQQPNQNLMWGNMFHKGLEHCLEVPTRIQNFDEEQHAKLLEVLKEEEKYQLHVNNSTLFSVLNMLKLYPDLYKEEFHVLTEQEFVVDYSTKNFKVKLKGKQDGVGVRFRNYLDLFPDSCETILIEHKSKENFDKQLFLAEAFLDTQLNIYLLALNRTTSCEYVVYDNVIIPELQWNCPPRQANERISAWIDRLYHKSHTGAYPVASKKFHWVHQDIIHHPMSKIETFIKETLNPIIDQVCYLFEYTQSDSFDPFNPDCYNHLFHKRPLRLFDPARTSKFKKNYWNHLVGEIPVESLVKTDKLFKELSDKIQ